MLGDGGLELGDVHVALEGEQALRVEGLVDDAVDGNAPGVEGMGQGGIEGHVEGKDVTGLHQGAEDHVLRRPPLVGGDDVVEAQHFLDGVLQGVEAVRPGVGLVSLHEGGPLVLAHGAGAGVGEEIDVDVLRPQAEHVEMPRLQGLFPGGGVGDGDGLHHFDAEGLGLHAHNHTCNLQSWSYALLEIRWLPSLNSLPSSGASVAQNPRKDNRSPGRKVDLPGDRRDPSIL
ncbi:MAG: hypothetical protein BWY88_01042 [Synergistetes bacterium ADurb.Bin520]|nr:MAG: hypothetical protein BWY88_01042 [Synergistetes bacterium ADurb.Bin520]